MRAILVIIGVALVVAVSAAKSSSAAQARLYVPFQQYNSACLDYIASGCELIR